MTETSTELLAEATHELRMTMHQLMEAGLNESQALLRVLPNDSNRREKLNVWKVRGLWPPLDLVEGGDPGQPSATPHHAFDLSDVEIPESWLQRITGMINTTINAAVLDYHNVQSDQMEEQVEATIREKLKESLASLETVQPDRIVELVRAAVQDMLADQNSALTDSDDQRVAPPRPRTVKGTRKLEVPRRKLQGTCDATLFELFEDERQSRGFNVSQMLDFILYNHYGQPRLSFEALDGKGKLGGDQDR